MSILRGSRIDMQHELEKPDNIGVIVLIPVPCHDKHLSYLPGMVLPCHVPENHDPLEVGVVPDLFHDRMYLAHVHMVY